MRSRLRKFNLSLEMTERNADMIKIGNLPITGHGRGPGGRFLGLCSSLHMAKITTSVNATTPRLSAKISRIPSYWLVIFSVLVVSVTEQL